MGIQIECAARFMQVGSQSIAILTESRLEPSNPETRGRQLIRKIARGCCGRPDFFTPAAAFAYPNDGAARGTSWQAVTGSGPTPEAMPSVSRPRQAQAPTRCTMQHRAAERGPHDF